MQLEDTVVASMSAHLSASLGGEFVILDLADEVYYGLDGVGARIWELVSEPRTIGSVIDAIQREYNVEPEICAHDTKMFLSELSRRSFVQIQSAAT